MTSPRILGIDLARALAIVGMVIVNYKVAMTQGVGEPPWLWSATAALEGRAAATFVVLAGIGASLGARRASAGTRADRALARGTLRRRGVVLFAMGWAFYPVWPADILHYYGVYLFLGSFLLFAPAWCLGLVAFGCAALSFAFIATFDYFAHWDLETLSYDGVLTLEGFLRNLFLDGFHPVLPWFALYLLGIVVGRMDLRSRTVRRRLVLMSLPVVFLAEAGAWWFLGPKGADLSHLPDSSWRWLFLVEPMPPLPMFLAAGGGTAVLVLVSCLEVAERAPQGLLAPWIATGRLALTVYVAHVLLGLGTLEAMGRLEDQDLSFAVATALVFCSLAVPCAWAWSRRFDRGPLEALLRRASGG